MRLRQQFLTKNDCYKAGRTIAVRGVMLHSTGANNPRVRRYVPGDGVIGRNTGGNHWNMSNQEAVATFGKKLSKCVHAFIGLYADGEVGTVQTLPWDMRGWHCGGYANNTHIGIEVCEDGLEDPVYFRTVYREAVELTAMLCGQFDLDPVKEGVLLCHAEGWEMGWASDHADVLHWFTKHDKSMHDFRADVARIMEEDTMTETRIREIVRDEVRKIEAERADLPASPWAETQLARAKAKGITDGSRPQSAATRQEVALMISAAMK